MKALLHKLLFAIPLRPSIAVLFCFLTGYLGVFLPTGHFEATYTAAGNTSEIIIPSYGEISGWLEIDGCPLVHTEWIIEPGWFFKYNWQSLSILWPAILVPPYLQKHFPPTRKRLLLFFFACLILAFVPIAFLVWTAPDGSYCGDGMSAIVHGVSVQWFTVTLWILSPLLGFYALLKVKAIKMPEKSP